MIILFQFSVPLQPTPQEATSMSRADESRHPKPVSLDDVLATWPKLGDLEPAPDGTHVIYEWHNALWAVNRRGKVGRLTDGTKPRWSPASAELAYLDGDPLQVWVRDPHGSGGRPLPRRRARLFPAREREESS